MSDAIAAQQTNIEGGNVSSDDLQVATKKSAEVLAADPEFPTTTDDNGNVVPSYVNMATSPEFTTDFNKTSDPTDETPVVVPPPEPGEELDPIPEEELPPPTGGGGTTG